MFSMLFSSFSSFFLYSAFQGNVCMPETKLYWLLVLLYYVMYNVNEIISLMRKKIIVLRPFSILHSVLLFPINILAQWKMFSKSNDEYWNCWKRDDRIRFGSMDYECVYALWMKKQGHTQNSSFRRREIIIAQKKKKNTPKKAENRKPWTSTRWNTQKLSYSGHNNF